MEFKIIDLFTYYLKNKILALIILAISLIFCYYYIFNIYEPDYIAQTTIMLGANNNTTDIGFNQSVVKNYLELVDSKNVLETTLNKTKLSYTKSELKNMINAYFEEDTEFITIEVTSKNSLDAAKLSYGLYEGLVSEVERIFKINNIHLVDSDTMGYEKYSEKLLICIMLLLSFVLSFGATTVNYLFFPNFNLQEQVSKLRKFIKEKYHVKKQEREKLKQEKKLNKNELIEVIVKEKESVTTRKSKKTVHKTEKKRTANSTKKQSAKKKIAKKI